VAVLEIVPPFPLLLNASAAQPCLDPANGNAPVMCTVWQYKLPSGVPTTNQLNMLVPAALSMFTPPGFPNGSLGTCMLYTGGSGDPTTGFGQGITAFNTCRLAPTAGNVTPNVVFATSPALPGVVLTQLKSGNKVFILNPA
jgi:hypothetical protein